MGQALVNCGVDSATSTEEGEPGGAPYTASSRSSQMLCEARDRSGWVVCAAVGRAIFIYCTAVGKKLGSLDGHVSPVTCLVGSSASVFSGSVDKTVMKWDLRTRRSVATFTGHAGPVWCLALRGQRLFSAGDDAKVIVWDTDSGARLSTISRHEAPVRCMVEAHGLLLTAGDDGTLLCSDSSTHAALSQVKAHDSAVTCLLAAEDGGVYTGSAKGLIRRWDPIRGGCVLAFAGHSESVSCLALAEGVLFSGSRDRTIRKWDPATGRPLGTFEHSTISFRQRSAFLTAVEDGTVCICRGADGEKFTKIDHPDGTVSLRTERQTFLSANPAGRVSASAGIGADERFELLETQDGLVAIRSVHGGFIGSTEGDAVAASCSAEGPTGHQSFVPTLVEGHWNGVTSLLLPVSGTLMSGGADRTVKLWDLETGMLLASLEGRTGITSLLEAGGSLYAGAARGTPLRLPKPKGSQPGARRASKARPADVFLGGSDVGR